MDEWLVFRSHFGDHFGKSSFTFLLKLYAYGDEWSSVDDGYLLSSRFHSWFKASTFSAFRFKHTLHAYLLCLWAELFTSTVLHLASTFHLSLTFSLHVDGL